MPLIDRLLVSLVAESGSDLHLSAGRPPFRRIHGTLMPVPGEPVLTSENVLDYLKEILPEANIEQLMAEYDTDCAYEITGVARFRVNGFCDMRGYGTVLRVIPEVIPSFEDLNLPEVMRSFCMLSKGLVIVTGPTGSGKSTTLAAMVDYINQNRNEHIITIEDPIEFVHTPKKCVLNQREVHRDTTSFARALRAALREDPDIVLVGELRDLETMEIAIETAETGHLVFATLHTNNAATAVERMIDKFPEGRQNQIRSMLADTLKGVIAQTLCKKIEGGRIAAFEVLVVNTAVAALIREAKTHMIPSIMQTGRKDGMQTFSDELTRQAVKGIISAEDAYMKAIDKVDIETKFRLAGLSLDFKIEAEQALRNTQMERARALLQTALGTLSTEPKNIEALCAAAWIMGSSPHADLRNGREAVKLAERASDLQRDKDPHALAVLGVAQAEYGSFRRAIDATNRAIALYTQSNESAKALALQNRLNLFKQNKAYRDE
ncbi:MAG TPA: type IV pilus twitching motility protein PilT [Kiritimatiellia bacterium]|jgi:twitching motility protein PilT|nr:MAG: Twitching mobility protein [Verrucomicrobia bacterium ADurb.Bin070]HPB09916.1 type IV pilus twitching motility protein PilT [Kiritimatiellia bacterium]HPO37086.1 type IV pilus twitching motility protein PilT [Kiritimatiellia bacterium]HQA37306.1 type IV pilus twitching motility protein PilT [Kiritimatiellia bacterium]HQL50574.1 type IV pilus twitching motility protein PilT [Kiritimatiellia bacterium]